MIKRELPVKEYTITMKNGEQLVKQDWNDLTVKNFIESLGISYNNVQHVKLTDLI